MIMRRLARRSPNDVRQALIDAGLSIVDLRWTKDGTRWQAVIDLTSSPDEIIRALLRSDSRLEVFTQRSTAQDLFVTFCYPDEMKGA